MRLSFHLRAWEDYGYWQATDQKRRARIDVLIADTIRSPLKGIGKPEPLGGDRSGWWSRRIDGEHRMVYRVAGKGKEQVLEIVQCRFHY